MLEKYGYSVMMGSTANLSTRESKLPSFIIIAQKENPDLLYSLLRMHSSGW